MMNLHETMRTEKMNEEKRQPLAELEKILAARLAGIEHELVKEHSADSEEQVTERENEDVLRNLNEETRHELQQVRQALRRLDAGDYGICAKCGDDISPARLSALPYATLCIKCAS